MEVCWFDLFVTCWNILGPHISCSLICGSIHLFGSALPTAVPAMLSTSLLVGSILCTCATLIPASLQWFGFTTLTLFGPHLLGLTDRQPHHRSHRRIHQQNVAREKQRHFRSRKAQLNRHHFQKTAETSRNFRNQACEAFVHSGIVNDCQKERGASCFRNPKRSDSCNRSRSKSRAKGNFNRNRSRSRSISKNRGR